tara:strand:- start:438 stop:548 length:111 start_codon:yes stop_codon:yes gene_type:complete
MSSLSSAIVTPESITQYGPILTFFEILALDEIIAVS